MKLQLLAVIPAVATTTSIMEHTLADMELSAGTLTTLSETTAAIKEL
jgi:hypothetical protein